GSAQPGADDVGGAGGAVPLLHAVLGEGGNALFVVSVFGSDADNREAKSILDLRVQIQIVATIGKRGFLDIGGIGAISVLTDKGLPLEPPVRHTIEGRHLRRRYRSTVGMHPQVATTDEIEVTVVEIVISPLINGDTLGRQSVPVVQIPGKQGEYWRTLMVAEVVLPYLAAVVGKPVGKRPRLGE